jgi:hypothetical protein
MADQPDDRFIVSAFYTDDGSAAYLKAGGSWVTDLQQATAMNAEDRDRWVADKSRDDQRAVCDPYAFKVLVKDGVIDPISAREIIRADGPTTRVRRPD